VRRGGKKTVAILIAAFASAASVAAASAPAASAAPGGSASQVVPVLFVGNNWDGTADVIRQAGTPTRPTFTRVARLNIIPDIDQRMLEIATDPVRLAYFLAIRQAVGEGHDQFVDDMFASKDGRLLVVSRPSLADVIGLDLNTGLIVWRFRVDGQRSDHMAMSPDGTRVAVSASTGNVVHILDTNTGQEAGSNRATRRTRTTTPPTAAGSTTPASGSSTRRPTSRCSTRRRGIAASRSLTRARIRSSSRSTWARSWSRPATRT
jgi:hypothetical protein